VKATAPGSVAAAGSNWRLTWDRGQADILAVGAALQNLVFRLEDGSSVEPLAQAPWIGEASVTTDASIPAHLRQLGGEWPCVPFGTTTVDPHHHGFGTDSAWHVVEQSADAVTLAVDYPEHHPVKRLERRIEGVAGEAAVAIELTVEARADCVLPVGLHPIFKLAGEGRRMRLDPGPFANGYTFPKVFEEAVSRLMPDAEFSTLEAVPLAGEGAVDLSQPPTGLSEEILQLAGAAGSVRLEYPDDGYQARLDWNADDFPSLVIWLSDCGRSAPPWSKRFRGIGIEPVNGFFDDTGLEPHRPNSLSPGRSFHAGERWTTRYRISASTLDTDKHEGPAK
jgi:galactose mutarotase-like enzyme